MPTGYTANVQNGKITEFEDFALQCARAFGALITMRDSPMDADIPDEIKPSDYHQNEIEACRLALDELGKLTDEDVIAACAATHQKAVEWREKHIQDKNEGRARYEAMLRKVEAWGPPTPDHDGLKNFMVSQLKDSISFDCSTDYLPEEPKTLTPTQWLNEQREKLTKDLAYHEEKHAEEVERCANKTEWIKALKASLKAATSQSQIEEQRSCDEVAAQS